MSIRVKVLEVEIKNFKNVLNGKIRFPSSKNLSFEKADVLGIYGQNGSGKTAMVEAFQVLKRLLEGKKLLDNTEKLIYQGGEVATLNFTFLIKINNSLYEAYYSIELSKLGNNSEIVEYENDVLTEKDSENYQLGNSVFVSKEEFRYKEVIKGSRPKLAIQYLRPNEEDSTIGPNIISRKIKSNKNDLFIAYKVNAELAYKEKTSFLFRKEGVTLAKQILKEEAFEILLSLKQVFVNNLFVISNIQSSLILANVMIPVHYKKVDKNKIEAGYDVLILPSNKPTVLPKDVFELAGEMFNAISKVLREVVPGLTVELRSLGEQTLQNGTIGIRAELIAIRDEIALPISLESDGIKKLVSILSSLIVLYNDHNACIIIDELDAGIFEFLLGEIVKILNDCGKGQLLFTSHNLRLLEVLEKDNLVFTTTNPEKRYINLKGLKETNNIRDVYIRAIQLGTDEEPVYQETDRYNIMDAFEEAGELNYG
ncbi:MAG: AAA family ATPase [Niallia nealsonii]|nr:AAA family ATPase [Niallia nealsonii]